MIDRAAMLEVASALTRVLPRAASLAIWEGGSEPTLHPDEAHAVVRAVESRRVEFARGRECARRALARLGGPEAPIGVGEQRQPVWPPGFVGSITHCRGLVAAVAARRDRIAALGLDAEPLGSLAEEVREETLLPDEWPGGLPAGFDTVLFSAKESVHKAVFPISGVLLDFRDVVVTVDPPSETFAVAAATERAARVAGFGALRGRIAVAGGYAVAVCYLETGAV
jgi:4'-phosphopantetheinyl transferase EntD